MCSVIMKVSRLICVTSIPLKDYALALDALTFGMFMHVLTLGILVSKMLSDLGRDLRSYSLCEKVSIV